MTINIERLYRYFTEEECDSVKRRDILLAIGLGTMTMATGTPVMGGPSKASDFEKLVPSDKKLTAEWIKSLFDRGTRTVYCGAELEKIGMPVGGLCAGQVYLSGDGKLWHWDVLNKIIHTGSIHYAHPLKVESPLQQGFAVRVHMGKQAEFRRLDRDGFQEIAFRGEYPIGLVEYCDTKLPVSVLLEAFSPFVPLDINASSLPATVMKFTVRNTSDKKVDVELLGWLENAIGLYTAKPGEITRCNRILRQPKTTLLECSATAADQTEKPAPRLQKRFDFGTMTLGLLQPQDSDRAAASISLDQLRASGVADVPSAEGPVSETLIGAVSRRLSLEPGVAATVTFVLTWHFPNLRLPVKGKMADRGRFYATQYASAAAVGEHVADRFETLYRQTRLWHDTWYDSSLPYWFLDRTFANTSILATSTCHRFTSGRFYGWEGVGSCEGTCTHVWHYAQAAARLFPELERDLRVQTDFGTAINPKTGVIQYRGEIGALAIESKNRVIAYNSETVGLAIDGQAGCILRAYREHQMSRDDKMLRLLWPNIKLAMQCLVKMDDGTGILQGPQLNTLDRPWYGKIAWLSSLYVAAARACEEMAKELGDDVYAGQMHEIVRRGGESINRELFNGEYYYQIADKDHTKIVGSYDGCEIDQVLGQSWAWQVGLGRILLREHTLSALGSLWKYNFTTDVGPYRDAHRPGRWYAMPGEGGLIMCTWPRGDKARVQQKFDYYFNECMTGFEYQVAGHMIWEGMVQEGLAIVRTIHDRYHASRRNPWNEVECGDHYARAMASYGVFLAACGFEYHGPKGYLAFAPRLTPENFKAAFTTAEGWGTFRQERTGNVQREVIELKWGKLRLKSLAFQLPQKARVASINVVVCDETIKGAVHLRESDRVRIMLPEYIIVTAGNTIELVIDMA